MTRDAETHEEEDKRKRQLAEAVNEADTLIYTVEKSLREYGNKVTDEEKGKINDALEKCKKMKEAADDLDGLRSAITELTTASHKIAEEMYKASQAEGAQQQAGAAPPPGEEGEEQKAKEDVVDAEFEEVDKDKKD
jgi:molecular chaperone DnaK